MILRPRTAGRFSQGSMTPPTVPRAKLDAADALGALGALGDEAGITLIQMAIAFVTRRPAVTSGIIGPRTREHLDTYPPRTGSNRPHRRAISQAAAWRSACCT
jgi:aryl-alcohol dehydrogenase-like predicted oxidoreductase